MTKKLQRICPMKEGPEKEIMKFILHQFKMERGLLHFINQYGGVNSKWLDENICYNISVHTFLKVLIIKIKQQLSDDSKKDWDALYDELYHKN